MTTGGAKSTASTLPHTPRPKSSATHHQRPVCSAQHASGRGSDSGSAAAAPGLAVQSRGRCPGTTTRATVAGRRQQAAARSPGRGGTCTGRKNSGGGGQIPLSVNPRRAHSEGRRSPVIGAEGRTSSTGGASANSSNRKTEATSHSVKGSSNNLKHVGQRSSSHRLSAQKGNQNSHSPKGSPSGMRNSQQSSSNSSALTSGKKSSNTSSHTLVGQTKVTSAGKVRPVQVVRPLQRVQQNSGASACSAEASSGSSSSTSSSSSSAAQHGLPSGVTVYRRKSPSGIIESGGASTVKSGASANSTERSINSSSPQRTTTGVAVYRNSPSGISESTHSAIGQRMGNPVSRELMVSSGLEDDALGSSRIATLPSSSLSSQVGSLDVCKKGKTLPHNTRKSVTVGRQSGSGNRVEFVGLTSGIHQNSSVTALCEPLPQSHPVSASSNGVRTGSVQQRSVSSQGQVGDLGRNIDDIGERTLEDHGTGRSKVAQGRTGGEINQNAAMSYDSSKAAGTSNCSDRTNHSKTEHLTTQLPQATCENNTKASVSRNVSSPQKTSDMLHQSEVSCSDHREGHMSSDYQVQVNPVSQQTAASASSTGEQNGSTSEVQSQSECIPAEIRNNKQESSAVRTQPTGGVSSLFSNGQETEQRNNGATNQEAFSGSRTRAAHEPTADQSSSSATTSRPTQVTARGNQAANSSENQTLQHQNTSTQPSSVVGHPRPDQPSNTSRLNPPSSVGTSVSSVAVDVIQNTGVTQPQDASDQPSALQRFDHNEALPDILNSHLLPPYTAIRPNQHRPARPAANNSTNRDRPSRSQGNSNRSRSRHQSSSPPGVTDIPAELKECCSRDCCVQCVTMATTFRWVLVSLALLGVCCVVTGIILGALHMTVGEKFLTLSLMFIGLGVLLVVVVGVGWRCTPAGHEPCHVLFNLGEHRSPSTRTRSTRQPRRDRGGWYGGMLYPEFRNRRPPPSYAASMQDHPVQPDDNQSRQNENRPSNSDGDNYSQPSSPPPTYRSQSSTVRPGIHITFPLTQGGAYPSSRPPTYRSSAGDARPSINVISDQARHESSDREGIATRNEATEMETVNRHPPQGVESGRHCSEAPVTRAPTSVAIDTECHSTIISVTTEGGTQRGARMEGDMGNQTSTLHREQEVVQYLEGVLDDQIRKLSAGDSGSEHDDDHEGRSGIVDELWYESERVVTAEKMFDEERSLNKVLQVTENDDISMEGGINKGPSSETCSGAEVRGLVLTGTGLSDRGEDSCTVHCMDTEGGEGDLTTESSESTGVTVNSYIATVRVKNYMNPPEDTPSTNTTTQTRDSCHSNSILLTQDRSQQVCNGGQDGHGSTGSGRASPVDTAAVCCPGEKKGGVVICTRDKDTQSSVITRTAETQTSESSGEEMEAEFSDTPL